VSPRGRDAGSFRRRIVLSTAALGALVAVALVVVVQLVLANASADAASRVLEDRVDAVVGATDATTSGHVLDVPEARLDPGVAVYDGQGGLVAGTVSPSLSAAFEKLATTQRTASLSIDDDYQLLARHFTTASGASGVVVIAERLQPYENDERLALVLSVAGGTLVVVLATALAAWASRRALVPVAAMAATAEEWSERDLDRRFDLGPPTDEIRALGHTLDQLLARVAGTILAEQRLTSELAHELRTPLTAIKVTADLVAMRPDLDPELRQDVHEIQESCRVMATTITSLLDLARAQSSGADPLAGIRSTASTCTLDDVLDDVRRHLESPDVLARVDAQPLVLSVPLVLAVRAVSPVVDNAVRHGGSVRVTATLVAELARIVVADDGPGIARGDGERIFEPGATTGPGSGLGLALARRVARGVGGDVVLEGEDATGSGGARFVVTLPARLGGRD
jgi:two-component system OmpR family sensor kinase